MDVDFSEIDRSCLKKEANKKRKARETKAKRNFKNAKDHARERQSYGHVKLNTEILACHLMSPEIYVLLNTLNSGMTTSTFQICHALRLPVTKETIKSITDNMDSAVEGRNGIPFAHYTHSLEVDGMTVKHYKLATFSGEYGVDMGQFMDSDSMS